MWTQQWPVTEFKKLDREARKIVVENGGKRLSPSTAILYMSREKEGRGLRSIEEEYKVMKTKAPVSYIEMVTQRWRWFVSLKREWKS